MLLFMELRITIFLLLAVLAITKVLKSPFCSDPSGMHYNSITSVPYHECCEEADCPLDMLCCKERCGNKCRVPNPRKKVIVIKRKEPNCTLFGAPLPKTPTPPPTVTTTPTTTTALTTTLPPTNSSTITPSPLSPALTAINIPNYYQSYYDYFSHYYHYYDFYYKYYVDFLRKRVAHSTVTDAPITPTTTPPPTPPPTTTPSPLFPPPPNITIPNYYLTYYDYFSHFYNYYSFYYNYADILRKKRGPFYGHVCANHRVRCV